MQSERSPGFVKWDISKVCFICEAPEFHQGPRIFRALDLRGHRYATGKDGLAGTGFIRQRGGSGWRMFIIEIDIHLQYLAKMFTLIRRSKNESKGVGHETRK